MFLYFHFTVEISTCSLFRRLFVYAHCRMAITGEDVSLDGIIPISYDFAVVEGTVCAV